MAQKSSNLYLNHDYKVLIEKFVKRQSKTLMCPIKFQSIIVLLDNLIAKYNRLSWFDTAHHILLTSFIGDPVAIKVFLPNNDRKHSVPILSHMYRL